MWFKFGNFDSRKKNIDIISISGLVFETKKFVEVEVLGSELPRMMPSTKRARQELTISFYTRMDIIGILRDLPASGLFASSEISGTTTAYIIDDITYMSLGHGFSQATVVLSLDAAQKK